VSDLSVFIMRWFDDRRQLADSGSLRCSSADCFTWFSGVSGGMAARNTVGNRSKRLGTTSVV